MSRLTTYRRPPINELLASAATIEALVAMRAEILGAIASGELQADAKTLRRWAESTWVRVLELMREQPRQAPYIFNVTLTWPKPPELAAAIEAAMRSLTAAL